MAFDESALVCFAPLHTLHQIDKLASRSITADSSFNGLHFLLQQAQVERLNISPDGSHSVVAGNQLIQRRWLPFHLIPLGSFDPNFAS